MFEVQKLFDAKLTDKGRELLAAGELTFNHYAFGDSEIDYNCLNNNNILPPLANNPNFTSYLKDDDCTTFYPVTGNCETLKSRIILRENNCGFFRKNVVELSRFRLESNSYKFSGSTVTNFNGTSEFNFVNSINASQFNQIENGDILMLKINGNASYEELERTMSPIPYLFYQITKNELSTVVKLDRNLPLLTTSGNTDFLIFPKDSSYYNSGTTIDFDYFDENCGCVKDNECFWNQTNVYCQPFIGLSGCTESIKNYQSSKYLGLMKYLGYCEECPILAASNKCEDKNLSQFDTRKTNIAIISFTELERKYGDYFFVDENNTFNLLMPWLMWHRRKFNGNSSGDNLGMKFTTNNVKKYTDDNLEYYELIEASEYVESSITVGRVYPNLKLITLDEPELVIATEYVSNRNFTLPALNGKMINDDNGILEKGKTLYLTYRLTSFDGIKYSFPQQKLTKFINQSQQSKNIEFYIESVGLFPYMQKIESDTYQGNGFYANNLKILYQIVDSEEDYPKSDKWMEVDYTNNSLTGQQYQSINPFKLELQDSYETQFTLSRERIELIGESNYILNQNYCFDCNDIFVKNNYFFGNIQHSFGKTIYRRNFKFLIDNRLIKSDNLKGETLYFSEIGIYNKKYEMVMVVKTKYPLKLRNDAITEVDIFFDF
jgi:hypothetical protein